MSQTLPYSFLPSFLPNEHGQRQWIAPNALRKHLQTSGRLDSTDDDFPNPLQLWHWWQSTVLLWPILKRCRLRFGDAKIGWSGKSTFLNIFCANLMPVSFEIARDNPRKLKYLMQFGKCEYLSAYIYWKHFLTNKGPFHSTAASTLNYHLSWFAMPSGDREPLWSRS